MRAMVLLLAIWLVSLYIVGLGIGYACRWATCLAQHRQEEAYRHINGGRIPPVSAKRGIGIMTAFGVIVGTTVFGWVAYSVGLYPPGAQGFTFWAYLILVMPGCAAGAAWGAALAVSKGPLAHWQPRTVELPDESPPRPAHPERRTRREEVLPHHYPGFEHG